MLGIVKSQGDFWGELVPGPPDNTHKGFAPLAPRTEFPVSPLKRGPQTGIAIPNRYAQCPAKDSGRHPKR